MRAFVRLSLPLLVAVIAVIAVIAAAGLPAFHEASGESAEVARLTSHFDSVLIELEGRDVSTLSEAQREARRRHIERLREYRDARTFPHNHVAAGRTPVFVDEHGTHCAVGYLIHRDGRDDLVRRIAGTRNLARIQELASDTALAAWLDGSGLTVAEAARIQPRYDEQPAVHRSERVRTEFAVGSAAYVGLSMFVASLNVQDPGRSRAYHTGALLGFAGIALASGGVRREGPTRTIAAVDAAAAVGSLAIAAWSANQARPAMASAGAGWPARLTLAPAVGSRGLGIAGTVRF